MKLLKTIFLTFPSLLILCCTPALKLKPTDKRPVRSIVVSDGDEAALIQQEVGAEIKYVTNNIVYFFSDNPNTNKQLESLGYTTIEVLPMQTSFRLVKMHLKKSQSLSQEEIPGIKKELARYGINVLKREETYWAIYGSVESLTHLEKSGYKLERLKTEIRPISVEIKVFKEEDIQKINELGIDIYSSSRHKEGFIIVYGGAYDYQIDLLESAGYVVKISNN